MVVTSTLFPGESCEEDRPDCAAHPIEVPDEIVAAVAFHTRSLGVLARRGLDDQQVILGEALFRWVALADGRPDFKATGSEWRTPPGCGTALVRGGAERAGEVPRIAIGASASVQGSRPSAAHPSAPSRRIVSMLCW